jgi:hypothetical protein
MEPTKTAATLLVFEQVGSSSTTSGLYFGGAQFEFLSGHRLSWLTRVSLFGLAACFILAYFSAVKIETIYCYETSVDFRRTKKSKAITAKGLEVP